MATEGKEEKNHGGGGDLLRGQDAREAGERREVWAVVFAELILPLAFNLLNKDCCVHFTGR